MRLRSAFMQGMLPQSAGSWRVPANRLRPLVFLFAFAVFLHRSTDTGRSTLPGAVPDSLASPSGSGRIF
ncbi:MAG: hypothetical protein ACTXOO_04115 [Sodalis sp. (in: enterobacteria)]